MAIKRHVEKTTKTLESQSLRRQGTMVYRTTMPTRIEPAIDDLIITVGEGDRMDVLANKYYGSASLWYIIAAANNITNGSMHFKPGEKIRIPSKNRVV